MRPRMTRIAAAAKQTRAFRASGIRKKDKGFFKQSSPCQKAYEGDPVDNHGIFSRSDSAVTGVPAAESFFHYVLIGFAQQSDKLEFDGMSAAQYLPPGGRGTAKRWMRNGDTFPFLMQSSQRVQPFPMYLFNEMHTDSEHIAVPHPPQCAHWGTFPPGEGIVRPSSLQTPICRTLGNASQHISKSSPKGIPHLISYISYLKSSFGSRTHRYLW